MRFKLGYVDENCEVEILTAQNRRHPLDDIEACVNKNDVIELKRHAAEIRISEEIKHYIVAVIRATRTAAGVLNGASPRASLTLMKASQALALFDGLEFVAPDHVQELAVPVIAHRLMLDPQARFSGTTAAGIVQEVLKNLAVPG